MTRRSPPADGAAATGRLTAAGPGHLGFPGMSDSTMPARLLREGDAAFGDLERVEIDLTQVARVDSAGLALLLEWSVAARATGRTLRYRNVPPAIASLAGISDVAELLAPLGGG